MISRKILMGGYAAVLMLCLAACGKTPETQEIVMNLEKLHSGDAKFLGDDKVVTSVGGEMCLYEEDGTFFCNTGIKSNWLNVLDNGHTVIYSNGENQTGIVQFDDKYQVRENQVLLNTQTLNIDPSIIKINDSYYFTTTEIVGNVNNGDEKQENGIYTVKLYRSENLQDCKYVTDIISAKANIEDTDLVVTGNRMALVYEREILDKKDSSIEIIFSENNDYYTWGQELELLQADCDHEPAVFKILNENEYVLYYSSDEENPSESYMGGNMYCAVYDKNFRLQRQKKIDSLLQNGILLYDIKEKNESIYFLSAREYLTDCDLVVEKISQ